MAKKSKQTNGIDTEIARQFVSRIENLEEEIASERGKFMNFAKQRRDDIKEIIVEAKDQHQIPKKALKTVIAHRKLERKAAALEASLDIDEGAAFEQMLEALGPLADLPLGQAALGEPIGDQASTERVAH